MAYTNDSIWKSVDWMTICIYLMLVIFGWFSVCGAAMIMVKLIFFSFDTRAGKQFVWICCSLGLGFILMMLEDKLYDMFALHFIWRHDAVVVDNTFFWQRIPRDLIHG